MGYVDVFVKDAPQQQVRHTRRQQAQQLQWWQLAPAYWHHNGICKGV